MRHSMQMKLKEWYHITKSQMMDTLMGGRAAEELIFGPDRITTEMKCSISRIHLEMSEFFLFRQIRKRSITKRSANLVYLFRCNIDIVENN